MRLPSELMASDSIPRFVSISVEQAPKAASPAEQPMTHKNVSNLVNFDFPFLNIFDYLLIVL